MSAVYDLKNHRPSVFAIQASLDDKTVEKIAKRFFNEQGESINEDNWKHNYKELSKAIDKGYQTAYDKDDVRMLTYNQKTIL